MAIEHIKRRFKQTLYSYTPYKVVSFALVFRRLSPQPDADGSMHQYTGADVYQMADPDPDVPGGLRFLLSFGAGRSMLYKRRDANGVLQDLHGADDFPTAQVLAQSARAAGAPRSEGGERGDLCGTAASSARVQLAWRSLCGLTCGCRHVKTAAAG
jgi:hypothetical protein